MDTSPGGASPGPRSPHGYGVERLGALSDGVFAVVLTLLVLELGLPDPALPGRELVHELADNVPSFIGWIVSFIVLARFWTIHHHVIATLARCRPVTVILNFVFLGLISLVPFVASLVGTYELEVPLALVLFSGTLGCAALSLGVLAAHVARELDLLHTPAQGGELAWHRRYHLLVVPGLAVLAAAAAFVHPGWTVVIWSVEAVVAVAVLARRSARATLV